MDRKLVSMFCSLFCFVGGYSNAGAPQIGITIEQPKPKTPLPTYALVDLGPTNIKQELLTKFAFPRTYAPYINNIGQISGNRLDEGFVRDFVHGELSPTIQEKKAYCFCLNNQGDILASLESRSNGVEWMVWVHEKLRNRQRYLIGHEDLRGSNLSMRSLNDKKIAVGGLYPSGAYRPVIWKPQEGFHTLSHYVGWDVQGFAYGVNNQNTVIGFHYNADDNPPFAWNDRWGLEILKNYRLTFEMESHKKIEGPLYFADIAITEDDRVYGTIAFDDSQLDKDERRYFSYWWEPKTKTFRYMNLEGMRINAVNSDHTLAGSWYGDAAICRRGETPVLLKDLVNTEDAEWKLIEASSMNDAGDIVGYGEYKGVTHLYLLKALK